ncbi:hypothetical protein JOC54_003182 [Alkalihalobacillus xiaoxiensis]|uniref:DUF4352 domain-containing protein n=1 Tax=Shouchella xiaoxiensis TaxID=766895 RepID=A0ABS2SWJ3_9BACI|nr:DUF4352 domain-containing protein [Shouchella xiaoxiensis]MBM7839902.1 hypothetical protein [Shouchella xiaoxiensis]
MKKSITLMATMMGLSVMLAACSDSDSAEENQTDPVPEEESMDQDVGEDESETNDGSSEGEDQMDLGLGDTAVMHSNISSFEFTLNSVDMVEEVDGELSDLDAYVVASITIKNIGDEAIDAKENAGLFEYTANLEGSGFGDQAEYYEDYQADAIEGELAPGEEVTGTAVYTSYNDDEQYIRVKPGTAGTGLINDAVFTFSLSDLEN